MRKLAGPCVAPPLSILLVSSETEARSLLKSILQKAQCRTFVCTRCRDAIDLIHLASVVICERFLPDGSWLDGVDVDYATASALIILQMPNNSLPIFQR